MLDGGWDRTGWRVGLPAGPWNSTGRA